MQKLVELAVGLKYHDHDDEDNHGDYDNLDDHDNSGAKDNNDDHDNHGDQDNLDNHDNSGAKDNNDDQGNDVGDHLAKMLLKVCRLCGCCPNIGPLHFVTSSVVLRSHA